jgi:hypothetical protein
MKFKNKKNIGNMDSSFARIKFAVSIRKNTENKKNIIEIKKK